MQMMNNSIRLYTYEDAVSLYKQRKARRRRNILTAAYNYIISNYIAQKIIGIVALIITLIISLTIHNATALVFLLPFCLGLLFINEKML